MLGPPYNQGPKTDLDTVGVINADCPFFVGNNYNFFFFLAAALTDILEAFEKHEQAPKLEQAKKNCGNDMLKTMQYVFPILVQIQMDVIKKYGFSDDRKG